jgi:hypothetical protein
MTHNTKNEVHEGHFNFTMLYFVHKYMYTQIPQTVVVVKVLYY